MVAAMAPRTAEEARRTLRVGATATRAQVRAAYRTMALQHHPDRLRRGSPEAAAEGEATFKAVAAAYALLLSTPTSSPHEPHGQPEQTLFDVDAFYATFPVRPPPPRFPSPPLYRYRCRHSHPVGGGGLRGLQVVSVEELLAEALQGEADMGTLEQRLLMAGGYCPHRSLGVDPTVPFTAGTRLPADILQRARDDALRSSDARTAAAMDAAAAELEQDARDEHEQRMRQLRLQQSPHSDGGGGADQPLSRRVTLTEQCVAALAAVHTSHLPPVVSVEWLVHTLTSLVHRIGERLRVLLPPLPLQSPHQCAVPSSPDKAQADGRGCGVVRVGDEGDR